MMRSMFAGVTGLRNHQVRMDVIANNIANVNTTAYKGSRANFKELFTQTIRGAAAPQGGRGGTNPMQVGLGVGLSSIDVLQTPGSLQPTGNNTDLAIQGEGFFVVSDGSQDFYTRDGAFSWDSGGYLVTNSGMRVKGWMAAAGVLPNPRPATLQDIQVLIGSSISPKATSQAVFRNNLDARSAVGASATRTFTVYDSLGRPYTTSLTLTKTAANNWSWTADVLAPTPTVGTGDGVQTAFDLAFDNVTPASLKVYVDGALQTSGVDYTLNAGPNPDQIVFTAPPASGAVITAEYSTNAGSGTLTFNPDGTLNTGGTGTIAFTPQGANPFSATLDFTRLTQFADDSTVDILSQDGYAPGTLTTVSIDTSGIITGVYSNGLNQALAQVALANFDNPAGLVRTANNMYLESNNSGVHKYGEAGTGGRGTIAPGSLEMSNVDLSQEFTNMIITQRGFQANSRVITTSDEMLQELASLKR